MRIYMCLLSPLLISSSQSGLKDILSSLLRPRLYIAFCFLAFWNKLCLTLCLVEVLRLLIAPRPSSPRHKAAISRARPRKHVYVWDERQTVFPQATAPATVCLTLCPFRPSSPYFSPPSFYPYENSWLCFIMCVLGANKSVMKEKIW